MLDCTTTISAFKIGSERKYFLLSSYKKIIKNSVESWDESIALENFFLVA
jgi:hypothetical protein